MLRKKKKTLSPLQKLKKSTRPKLVPLSKLGKEADREFSRYVRLRDSEFKAGQWIGECISCQKKIVVIDREGKWNKYANLGHYITRGHRNLRWDEGNCNLQCSVCNLFRDKGDMLLAYRRALCLKIGDEGVSDLEVQAKIMRKPGRQELETTIADAQTYVEWTLAHPNALTAKQFEKDGN